MSFKPNVSLEKVQDYVPSNYISSSGMFPVTLLAVIEKKNEKGAKTWSFFVDHEGQEQLIFDAIRLDNNDGSENFQINLAHKLSAIAEITDEITTVKEVLPIGKKDKDGKPTDEECDIYAEFCDLDIILRIQMEYNNYEGEIREKKIIRNIFRADDCASAAEILNKVSVKEGDGSSQESYLGKQFTIEDSKGHSNSLKDGLTQEEVDKWIAGGRGRDKKTDSKTQDKQQTKRFTRRGK